MNNLKTEHEIEIDQIHDRQLSEKDAEIARLKAQVEESYSKQTYREWERNKALITELADALEEQDPGYDRYKTLIKNAREATR